jgi:hypothetical protein
MVDMSNEIVHQTPRLRCWDASAHDFGANHELCSLLLIYPTLAAVAHQPSWLLAVDSEEVVQV